jgi:Ca2+-transporting ATPase
MDWYKQSPAQVIEELNTNVEIGLSESDAHGRLQKFGPNELVERGKKSILKIILDQFTDLMVIILILAAIVSAFLGETIEVVVILAIVILNGVLGYPEYGLSRRWQN